MSQGLLAKAHAAKRFRVECEGLTLLCVRPTQAATTVGYPTGNDDEKIIAWVVRHIEGWEGATESMFVDDGKPDKPVEFDAALLKSWFADHVPALLVVSSKLFEKFDEWSAARRAQAETEKNS